MSNTIERLKEHIATLPDGSPSRPMFDEAVAELERLNAEADALKAVAGKASAGGQSHAAVKHQTKHK